jgi:hypothetical protein
MLILYFIYLYPNDTNECHCKHTNKCSHRGYPNGVHNNIKNQSKESSMQTRKTTISSIESTLSLHGVGGGLD